MRNSESYGSEYFQVIHKNWFLHPNIQHFRRIAKEIKLAGCRSVLDLGCGNGDFLRFLRQHDPDLQLTGVDIVPLQPIEGVKLIQTDMMEGRIAGRFDAVLALAVIEHMEDVGAFVRRLKGVCTPGGLIVTMTVNDRSVLYGTARALRSFGYHVAFDRLYSRHHLNHFTIHSLNELMRRNNLSVMTTIRHNAPLSAMDLPPGHPLVRAILRFGVWGTFVLGTISGRTYQQTIVCRKPAL